MHTILGSGGVIGREVSRLLAADGVRVRQVSRAPEPVDTSDELVSADLLDRGAVARAVEGSEVAYLTAGLRYSADVWEREWPRIMDHVIEACAKEGCRLVFLDNVYAYGRVVGAMTEETPFNPCSRKGEVRAQIATRLLRAMSEGLEAMIVRAADFYGPGATLALTHATVFERLRRRKRPQWIGDPDALHSFTFTPDAARSVVALARTPDAYGETWHAATHPDPITGRDFVRLACDAAGRPVGLQALPRWLLRVLGLFVTELRENDEMIYQWEHDYVFDASKLRSRLRIEATPYHEGIPQTLHSTLESPSM